MHLEYYEGAVDYLMNHPKIYSKRGIGISGVSKGGENALAMAAFLSPAKIGAVMVLNTSIQSTICPVMYKNQTLLEGSKLILHTQLIFYLPIIHFCFHRLFPINRH